MDINSKVNANEGEETAQFDQDTNRGLEGNFANINANVNAKAVGIASNVQINNEGGNIRNSDFSVNIGENWEVVEIKNNVEIGGGLEGNWQVVEIQNNVEISGGLEGNINTNTTSNVQAQNNNKEDSRAMGGVEIGGGEGQHKEHNHPNAESGGLSANPNANLNINSGIELGSEVGYKIRDEGEGGGSHISSIFGENIRALNKSVDHQENVSTGGNFNVGVEFGAKSNNNLNVNSGVELGGFGDDYQSKVDTNLNKGIGLGVESGHEARDENESGRGVTFQAQFNSGFGGSGSGAGSLNTKNSGISFGVGFGGNVRNKEEMGFNTKVSGIGVVGNVQTEGDVGFQTKFNSNPGVKEFNSKSSGKGGNVEVGGDVGFQAQFNSKSGGVKEFNIKSSGIGIGVEGNVNYNEVNKNLNLSPNINSGGRTNIDSKLEADFNQVRNNPVQGIEVNLGGMSNLNYNQNVYLNIGIGSNVNKIITNVDTNFGYGHGGSFGGNANTGAKVEVNVSQPKDETNVEIGLVSDFGIGASPNAKVEVAIPKAETKVDFGAVSQPKVEANVNLGGSFGFGGGSNTNTKVEVTVPKPKVDTNINIGGGFSSGLGIDGGVKSNSNLGLNAKLNSPQKEDHNISLNKNQNLVTGQEAEINAKRSLRSSIVGSSRNQSEIKWELGVIPKPTFEEEPHTTLQLSESLRSHSVCARCILCGHVNATDIHNKYNLLNMVLGFFCCPAWMIWMAVKRKDYNCYNADHYCTKCEKYIDTYSAC